MGRVLHSEKQVISTHTCSWTLPLQCQHPVVKPESDRYKANHKGERPTAVKLLDDQTSSEGHQ